MKNASWGGSGIAGGRGKMSVRGEARVCYRVDILHALHILWRVNTRPCVIWQKGAHRKKGYGMGGQAEGELGQPGSHINCTTKKVGRGRGRDCHPFDRGDIEKSRKENVAKIMES